MDNGAGEIRISIDIIYDAFVGMKGHDLHLTHRSFSSTLQARNARVTINAVHPGIVKTGIIRAHKGFITGMDSRFFPPSSSMLYVNQCCSSAK